MNATIQKKTPRKEKTVDMTCTYTRTAAVDDSGMSGHWGPETSRAGSYYSTGQALVRITGVRITAKYGPEGHRKKV